jgi:hypothetical protein
LVSRALILFFVLWSSSTTWAYVTVYSPRWDCESLMLQKRVQGMRLSLADDPTLKPAVDLPAEDYKVEVLQGVDHVRSIYQEIFKARNLDETEATAILAGFAKEDQARVQQTGQGNGLDNTVYFVTRSLDGSVRSIVRATILKRDDRRGLPLENYVHIPTGNRVELERAYNAPGPKAHLAASELMMVLAKFLNERFPANDYTIYLLTDSLRARHYRSEYGFQIRAQTDLEEHLRYLCLQKGEAFYDRYVGHVQRAYAKAFYTMPYGSGRQEALDLLRTVEKQTGMHDYVPNLVGQAVILAAFQDYRGAVEVSDHLREVGSAEINRDYYALWQSRTLFNPFTGQGDPVAAQAVVDQYLQQNPLPMETYNDRALLFLIYELKILFGQGDLDAARALLNKNVLILRLGQIKMLAIYRQIWDGLQSSVPSPQRRWYTQMLLDLSTHYDPFATSVLYAETWNELARLSETNGEPELAKKYFAIGKVLEEW